MQTTHSKNNQINNKRKIILSYVTGFLLSLILTLTAYTLVILHQGSYQSIFSSNSLLIFILILAVIQLIVQLLFFLHLSQERKPYWNSVFLISTVGIILIVVVGSIWIMSNLRYNMMPPSLMDEHMMHEEGIYLQKTP